MIITKSITAAAYITITTGVEAELGYEDIRDNYWKFPETEEVLKAYKEYKQAVENPENEEYFLYVNMMKYNACIRKYKQTTIREKAKVLEGLL